MAEVRARNIRKSHGGTPALADFDLTLPDGEITVLLGPSGCGKTSFLRILAGLAEPDSGSVSMGERVLNDPRSRVPPERRRIGMVFQDSLLWPHLSVRRNIAFPLGRGGESDPRVVAAARAADIEGFLDRHPGELSGGEKQRVAIARAIVSEPDLLLLDEPLSGLDANLRVRMLSTIRSVQRKLGVSACYVTHDQEEAMSLADRVAVMRGGRVLQVGTPEEVYSRPRTAFVAGFVGLSALIPGRAAGGRVETELGSFAAENGESGDVLLAVRPETVRLDTNGGVDCEVRDCAFRGDRWLLTLGCGDRELLALSPRARRGERIAVSLEPPPVPVVPDEELGA